MSFARVITPGMHTTVQDLGRPGHGALGVPVSGAADTLSLRIGNRLLGNADNDAALEFTLIGPTIEFSAESVVCLTGGVCPRAHIGEGEHTRAVRPCIPARVRAGERVTVGPLATGARGYLCVAGGFDVPRVLDSRATLVSAGIGGHHGRSLRSGDTLPISRVTGACVNEALARSAAEWLEATLSCRTVRVTPSLHTEVFPQDAIDSLTRGSFVVSDQSNRAGLRLSGPALGTPTLSGSLSSEGVVAGCVQVPTDGQPIVLGVDGPTTGGYAVLASVIGADLPILGAVRPRETLRFAMTTRDEARRIVREQDCAMNDLLPAHAATRTIDLNADVGEATTPEHLETEAALIRVATSVNVACGGHAGDETSMRRAIALAAASGCAIGAHPSYPDLEGFGRRKIDITPDALRDSLVEQIAALGRVASELGARISHVKPHGALYHAASENDRIARSIFDAASAWDPAMALVGAAGSRAVAWWRAWGARVIAEAFADRAYAPDGRLLPREAPAALIVSPGLAAEQAVSVAVRASVRAVDGTRVEVVAQTICLHADTPGAAKIARRVARALTEAGVELRPYSTNPDL